MIYLKNKINKIQKAIFLPLTSNCSLPGAAVYLKEFQRLTVFCETKRNERKQNELLED